MEIVSAVRNAIAGRVGKERFEMWLDAGANLRLSGKTLHLLVSDSFKLERVRRNIRKEILAAASESLGFEPELILAVNKPLPLLDPLDAISPPQTSDQIAAGLPHPSASSLQITDSEVIPFSSATVAAPVPQFQPQRRNFSHLESFIVGDKNRVAYSAAMSVLARLGQVSPMTFYGPPGCGKTHLLEGIWCWAKQPGQVKRVIYLTAEQFTSHFIEAIRGGTGLPSFRRKYRELDLLLIDDVQFFAGKTSTLIEFQHTIDALLRAGKQIIFAADRPPTELRPLGPEITARLSGGLVCDVGEADGATRLGILASLARQRSLTIPQEVLEHLAAHLPGDARRLVGALNRLEAASEALAVSITLDFARNTLADLLHATQQTVRLPDIVGAVSHLFGLEPEQMQSASKAPAVSHPRMLAMWLARKYTRSALSEIGRQFGRKSHSTVLSAEGKVEQWLTSGKTLALPHGQCTVEEALRRIESHLRLG